MIIELGKVTEETQDVVHHTPYIYDVQYQYL